MEEQIEKLIKIIHAFPENIIASRHVDFGVNNMTFKPKYSTLKFFNKKISLVVNWGMRAACGRQTIDHGSATFNDIDISEYWPKLHAEMTKSHEAHMAKLKENKLKIISEALDGADD